MTTRGRIVLSAFALLFMLATNGIAQQPELDLRQEIKALKEGQQAIQKDLQELLKLLQARRPQRRAAPDVSGMVFNLRDNPVKGEKTAMLTLIEFTDYQWPFCGRHVRGTYPQIDKAYISTGKLKYAVLDFPLEAIHPLAFKASEATHCAQEQGKFWEMHERFFANQRKLEPFNGHAEALGLDVAAFETCLKSGKYAKNIRQDMAEGQKGGTSGTPSFILGRTDPNDPSKVKGISFIRGAQPFSAFKAQIDRALTAAAQGIKAKAAETK